MENTKTRRSTRNKSRNIEYWKPGAGKPPSGNTRRWSDDEILKFLTAIQLQGHKNLKKIQNDFPGKNHEELRAFFTAQKVRARKQTLHRELDNWLNVIEAETKKNNIVKWVDSHAIAQVMKYLSVDGFLENHPLPDKSQGIDFPAAYRLLYQALVGYPMQPVNRETAKFILNTLEDLGKSVRKITETDAVISFLREGCKERNGENPEVIVSNAIDLNNVNPMEIKKPIKTYQKKKKVETTETPVLSLEITASHQESTACSSQSFSVKLGGDEESFDVNVPVPMAIENNSNKEILNELYKSVSFNPLQIPERWLTGELKMEDITQPDEDYVNLGQKKVLYRHYDRGGLGFYNKS